MTSSAKLVAILLTTLLLSGCGGLGKEELVLKPGTPYLITEGGWKSVKISVWDEQRKEMVSYGWVKTKSIVGWTCVDFDWSEMKEKEK